MDITPAKERILSQVDLADLIGSVAKVESRGGRLWACCPFHNEKTASLTIYDRRYHCFGCKAGGDAIEFVRQIHGLSFFDALRHLAEKYGIEAPELDAAQRSLGRRRDTANLHRLMLDAQQFFHEQIKSERGSSSREYLEKRGFTKENIDAFGFGLTPPEPYGLIRHLREQGHNETAMTSCGLATSSAKDGRRFDFFRNRIMIPIRDGQGRVIAFGGRTIDDHKAKYMNSGATELFDKSRVLFGLDRARSAIRHCQRAVIVEGYMDALQLWQCELAETVACMGTALTVAQLKQLRHLAADVILLFDGDGAGLNASLHAVSVALEVSELNVRVAALPAGEDPDSFVRSHGKEAIEELLDQATNILDFVITQKLRSAHKLAIPDLIQKEFIPWLAQINDSVQRSFLIAKISQASGVPRAQIELGCRRLGAQYRSSGRQLPRKASSEPDHGPHRGTIDPLTYELIGHLYFAQPGQGDFVALVDKVRRDFQWSPGIEGFVDELLAVLSADEIPSERELVTWEAAGDLQIAHLIEKLTHAADAFRGKDALKALHTIAKSLQSSRLKHMISELKTELHRVASDPQSQSETRALLGEIHKLNQEVESLKPL